MSRLKRSVEIKVKYPSAELLQTACRENYRDLLDRYNKIYDKVSIALGFCGVILLVVLNSFDYRIFIQYIPTTTKQTFSVFVQMICSSVSCICIMWALIQLLLTIRGMQVKVFDSLPIRDKKIYSKSKSISAVFLIESYSEAIEHLNTVISQKQQRFDSAITKIVIAILAYALLVISKGGK